MTEYAWPVTLRPSRLSFYLQHNTLRFVSPVSRATQVLRRDGARWIAEASFDPLNRTQAGVLEGLLAALAIRRWPRARRAARCRSSRRAGGRAPWRSAPAASDGVPLPTTSPVPSVKMVASENE